MEKIFYHHYNLTPHSPIITAMISDDSHEINIAFSWLFSKKKKGISPFIA